MVKRGGGRERNSEHTSEREEAASLNTCNELVRARGTQRNLYKKRPEKEREERERRSSSGSSNSGICRPLWVHPALEDEHTHSINHDTA